MRRKTSRKIMKLAKLQCPENGLRTMPNGQVVNTGFKGLARIMRKGRYVPEIITQVEK